MKRNATARTPRKPVPSVKRAVLPADIEITPAMVEAGKLALIEYDNRFDSYEDGARQIFEAMYLAALKT